jgi:hypothetical protein
MTEAEWLACTQSEEMFRLIRNRDTVRQSRCILRELLLPYALRGCNEEQVNWARTEIDLWVDDGLSDAPAGGTRTFPKVLADRIGLSWPKEEGCRKWWEPRDPDRCLARRLPSRLGNGERQTCCVIRELFGPHLFRPITIDPSWLTSNVLVLAAGIYSEKAFKRMPILAEALQDAGCDNDDILNHCRQPGEHVRGCFVVDFVLGKT